MFLIGGLEILDSSSDSVEKFYLALLPRLKAMLSEEQPVSRLVGYRSDIDIVEGKIAQFFGIEMPAGTVFDDDLTGWDLTGNTLVVTAHGGENSLPIKWIWEDLAASFVGEFTSASMTNVKFESEELCWHLTTNSPVSISGPEEGDCVELVDYQDQWPARFEEFKAKLEVALGDVATSIIHYGSTAIPGMPAKPVIDILIEVPSFELAAQTLITNFNSPEYEYWWYNDHMIFIRRDKPFGKRTHHIHIAPTGHRLWEGVIFRDYLIENDRAAGEYRRLKEQLAEQYRFDREAYTKAKTQFVTEMTEKAMKEHKSHKQTLSCDL
jgi:GrpB-like predicted nucleotidyltransferase (UPF0157 family)